MKVLRCRLELIMKDVLKLTEDRLDELVGTMDEVNKSILIGVVAGAFDHVLFCLKEEANQVDKETNLEDYSNEELLQELLRRESEFRQK